MRRPLLAAALVLAGCDPPPAPTTYVFSLPFSVPDGTEVLIEGKAMGAFTKQRAKVRLPSGQTLKPTSTMAIRLATVCGTAERAVKPSKDALAGRKDDGEASAQTIALSIDLAEVPTLTTVWVDPEAPGEVRVGTKVLGKGPNRVLFMDCDEAGRTLRVGDEERGPLPAYAPKSHDQLFVPKAKDACYAFRRHVYVKGALDKEQQTSKPLRDQPFYVLPLINHFLQPAPDTIEALPGSPKDDKRELARAECNTE